MLTSFVQCSGKDLLCKMIIARSFQTGYQRVKRGYFYFIWGGNTDKVKRAVMINSVRDGGGRGLKVTHIPTFMKSFKFTWVKRYCISEDNPCKTFLDIHFGCVKKCFPFDVIVETVMMPQIFRILSLKRLLMHGVYCLFVLRQTILMINLSAAILLFG